MTLWANRRASQCQASATEPRQAGAAAQRSGGGLQRLIRLVERRMVAMGLINTILCVVWLRDRAFGVTGATY